MLSNSSSQVRKEGKTRSLLGRRRRGGGKIVRNTTRFAKETRRRNKKETLLAKVAEKDGAKRRETEIEGIETEAISPERWGRARFLRPALAQFCAMQVCGGTTATGYTALTGYVFRSVELETSLSLSKPGRLSGRFVRERGPDGAVVGGRSRQWCQPGRRGGGKPPPPRKVGGFVCKHGPSQSSCRSLGIRRWECRTGEEEEGRLSPSEGGYVTWARAWVGRLSVPRGRPTWPTVPLSAASSRRRSAGERQTGNGKGRVDHQYAGKTGRKVEAQEKVWKNLG